jgi:ethanolamine utilization microcompartment shell protein EutS
VIDFRYHVVSIVAVFLALALGLFVGSTTLQSTVTDQLNGAAQSVRNDNKKLEGERDTLRGQLSAIQRFDAAAENRTVAGTLTGQTVVVVSAPGVDDTTRRDLDSTLAASGAVVSATVELASAYLEPSQAPELGALAHDLAPSGSPAATGRGVDDASQVLADVLGTRAGRQAPAAKQVQATLSAFQNGKLISVAGKDPRPATLGILLLPGSDANAQPADVTQQAADLATFARDLDATSGGVVVTGPTAGAGDPDGVYDDLVKQLGSPSDSGVSTADAGDLDGATDLSYARVTTVLALADQRDGNAGSYGLGSSSALPSPSATP